jgi:hypothetical protein
VDERTLEKVIATGCRATSVGSDGAELRYRPEVQHADVGPLVEVRWPAVWGDGDWRLLEVFKSGDDWGCLPARVADNGFTGRSFRLPRVPSGSWSESSDSRV